MRITAKGLIALLVFLIAARNATAADSLRKDFHPALSGKYDTLGVQKTLEVGLRPDETSADKAALGTLNIESLYTYWGNFNIENELFVGTNGTTMKVVKGRDYNGVVVPEYRVGIGIGANPRPYEALELGGAATLSGGFFISILNRNANSPYLNFSMLPTTTTMALQSKGQDYAPLYFHGSPHVTLNARPSYDIPIESTGNVGIGVINPTVKLDVDGVIMAHNYDIVSSRTMKTDIQPLAESDYKKIFNQAASLKMTRYHYKNENADQTPHLGVIAEETPKVLLSSDKKAVSLSDEIGFMIAVTKELVAENREIERQILILEDRYASETKHVA